MNTTIRLFLLSLVSVQLFAAVEPVIDFAQLVKGGKSARETLKQECAKGKPVVLKFFMDNCGPCRANIQPFSELATDQKYFGKVTFIKIDAIKFDELVQEYNVQAVPTFVLIENGQKKSYRGIRPEGFLQLIKELKKKFSS